MKKSLAATAIGFPKTQGIERVLRWLHPMEQPHKESVNSIYALAVKELTRMMTYGGTIEPASGVVRLCEQWHKCGVRPTFFDPRQPPRCPRKRYHRHWDASK